MSAPRSFNPTSRGTIRVVLAALAGIGLVATGLASASARGLAGVEDFAEGEQNMIVVVVDDLSANLLPYMSEVQAMAADGVTFPNYFNATPWCCPSRATLQSGKYPHNSHVLSNGGANGGFGQFLANDMDSSVGVQIQAQGTEGYRTGFMGKYLNGYKLSGQSNPAKPMYGTDFVPPGWDSWFSGKGYQHFKYVVAESVDGSPATRESWKGSDADNYYTDVLSERAQSFISTESTKPFFLMLTPYAPHTGIGLDPQGRQIKYPPAPRDRADSPKRPAKWGPPEFATGDCGPVLCEDVPWPDVVVPGNFNQVQENPLRWMAHEPLSPEQLEVARAAHIQRIQAVQSVNDMLIDIRQTLVETGKADSTWIMFSSDNGYHLGEHATQAGKTTAYDHDIKVPLVVHPPGGTGSAITVDALVQNTDLLPTLLEIAGGTPPADVDGMSILPALFDPGAPTRAGVLLELTNDNKDPDARYFNPDLVGAEADHVAPTYDALRTEEYLYIDYSERDAVPPFDGEAEFYDLATDPAQMINLYPTLPEEFRQALNTEMGLQTTCTGGGCWAEQLEVPLLHPPTQPPTTEPPTTEPPTTEPPTTEPPTTEPPTTEPPTTEPPTTEPPTDPPTEPPTTEPPTEPSG